MAKVAERDRAAVGVHLRRIVGQTEITQDRQCLGGEGFVHFDDIHLRQRQSGQRQHLAHRRGRVHAHDPWWHAGGGHADDAGQRLQAVAASGGFGSEQQRAGAVVDAGRIAGGDAQFRAVDSLEAGQHGQRCFGARVFVTINPLWVAFFCATKTATSSSAKRQAASAAAQRCCERSAKAS